MYFEANRHDKTKSEEERMYIKKCFVTPKTSAHLVIIKGK